MITLLSYFKNYKLRLFITIIIKIIGTLCELVIPYILSYVLDEVIPNIEGHNIKPIIIKSKEDNSLIQLIVPIRTY